MRKALLWISKEFYEAQQKHPEFANDVHEGLNLITEEYLELVRAINDQEGIPRIREEAAQMGVTILRFLETLPDE